MHPKSRGNKSRWRCQYFYWLREPPKKMGFGFQIRRDPIPIWSHLQNLTNFPSEFSCGNMQKVDLFSEKVGQFRLISSLTRGAINLWRASNFECSRIRWTKLSKRSKFRAFSCQKCWTYWVQKNVCKELQRRTRLLAGLISREITKTQNAQIFGY